MKLPALHTHFACTFCYFYANADPGRHLQLFAGRPDERIVGDRKKVREAYQQNALTVFATVQERAICCTFIDFSRLLVVMTFFVIRGAFRLFSAFAFDFYDVCRLEQLTISTPFLSRLLINYFPSRLSGHKHEAKLLHKMIFFTNLNALRIIRGDDDD